MTNKIKSKDLAQKLQSDESGVCLIDVRSEDEFKSGTIKGAHCIPHTEIENKVALLPKDKKIVLFCKSGNRSAKAKEALKDFDFHEVNELEGGIQAWTDEHLPIVKVRSSIPIQRQVMISAGLLILTGSLLGIFFNPWFQALSIFVGAGLMFAGISGFCGLALLLEKMPWNKEH